VARGDNLPVELDERHHTRLESGVGGQRLGIPGGAMAEAKVLTDRDVGRAQTIDEHLIDELLRALLGEAPIERDHDQLLDAQPRDQLLLDLEAREQLGSRLRADHLQRMGLEGQHRVAAADHFAVAEVDSVELSDGDAPRPGFEIG